MIKEPTPEDLAQLKALEAECSTLRMKYGMMGIVMVAINAHKHVAVLADIAPHIQERVPFILQSIVNELTSSCPICDEVPAESRPN